MNGAKKMMISVSRDLATQARIDYSGDIEGAKQ